MCPASPALQAGVKGHNKKRSFISGKPCPMGGELHIRSHGGELIGNFLPFQNPDAIPHVRTYAWALT